MSDLLSGIAVVGLACRFPGARDAEAFWRNLRAGVESISFFSRDELLAAGVDPAEVDDPNYVPAGAVLEYVDLFDAPFFGLTLREAELMDPQHRLFLETAWSALESSGYDPTAVPGLVGVFAGESTSTYLYLLAADPRLRRALGSLQTMLGVDRDFLATLVSYKLNLRGPSFTVQTACSTSLVAVALACQSLRSFECDVALAGGASIRVPSTIGYFHQEGGIRSPDGHCRAFDAAARGTVGGSGVGVVVLKRMEDALAAGDTIRAVLRGWAINNDGSLKMGFTAPSVEGQAEVIATAQAVAGVEPDSITCIEAHGTATPLGDPIEVAALTRAFREGTERRGFCALGSVKTNIGHLDATAGIAGLIKTVLALEHRELPPSLHFQTPNPEIDFAASPFYVNAALRPWDADGTPLRAGVSSFGLGGTNAHVVLEEAPALEGADEDAAPVRPRHLLVLSARSEEALDTATTALSAWLESHPDLHPADVAWTLQAGRKPFEHRRITLAGSVAEAARVLWERAPERVFTAVAPPGKGRAVFLFPGQGVQHAGMGSEVYAAEPVFREHVDLCAELVRSHLDGFDLRSVLTPAPGGEKEAERHLARAGIAQPALFTLQTALAALWRSWCVHPAGLIGHSLGEYAAAWVAGVFSLEDALAVVAARGRLLEGMDGGAMLGVPLPEAELERRLGPDLDLAAVNAPTLCTVSGPVAAIARLERELAADGVTTRRLDVDCASHSAMVDPLLDELTRRVAAAERRPPTIPLISGLTGTWIEPGQAMDPAYWAAHLRQPVRFAAGLAELLATPGVLPVELSPGGNLAAFARRQTEALAGRPVLPSLPRPQDGSGELEVLYTSLGRFWAAGGEVSWEAFQEGRRRRRVPLPGYPFERKRYWPFPEPSAPEGAYRAAAVPREGMEAGGDPGEVAVQPTPLPAAPVRSGDPRPRLSIPYAPPRTATERLLAELWEELLGLDRVGVDDEFLALGGSSLLALEVLTRVRQIFGRDLHLRVLLEEPTVARLAAHLDADGDGAELDRPAPRLPGSLIALQPGDGNGARIPLFLAHPAGGHVLSYGPLATGLGADWPVYGLEARGLHGEAPPFGRIEEMAAWHLKGLLAFRPHGPYLLGGASLGGAIAWEMARQLQDRGHPVAGVILLDTPGPGQLPPELRDDAEVIAWFLGRHLDLPLDALRALAAGEQLAYALDRGAAAGLLPAGLDPELARSLLEVFKTHDQALLRYEPGPLSARVLFFRAAERRPGDPLHPELPWIGLARDGIEIHVVPGDHESMNFPPHVETLAARLRRCLEGER